MKMEAIIVLGAHISDDGILGEHAIKRVEKAVELYRKNPSSIIILSGKHSYLKRKKPAMTESMGMKKYALQLGIPASKILLEQKSLDTIGNAFYTKKILTRKKMHSVYLVTSDFHNKRAAYIFKRVLGKNYSIKPTSVNVKTPLDLRRKEKKIFTLTKKYFEKINPKNDAELELAILQLHPAYAKSAPQRYFRMLKLILARRRHSGNK